jgi:hypothetical protein
MSDRDDIPTETLAETENYMAWISDEPDGERVYHLELGRATLHFFREEWDELLDLIRSADQTLKNQK